MAGDAVHFGVSAAQREHPLVVEPRDLPTVRRVAGGTVPTPGAIRELAAVLVAVAGDTGRIEGAERHCRRGRARRRMTLRAGEAGMPPGEFEARGVVIEERLRPGGVEVAAGALGGDRSARMRVLMAGEAVGALETEADGLRGAAPERCRHPGKIGGRGRGMAGIARHRPVGSDEGEAGRLMTLERKRRRPEGVDGVAGGTVLVELADVGIVVMAVGTTAERHAAELAAGMAGLARQRAVRPEEGEAGAPVVEVVERHALPTAGDVTGGAGRPESSGVGIGMAVGARSERDAGEPHLLAGSRIRAGVA